MRKGPPKKVLEGASLILACVGVLLSKPFYTPKASMPHTSVCCTQYKSEEVPDNCAKGNASHVVKHRLPQQCGPATTPNATSIHKMASSAAKQLLFSIRLHACCLTLWLMSNILKKYGMAAGWFRWSQASTNVAKASKSISSRAQAAPGGNGGGQLVPPPLCCCCRLLLLMPARGLLAGERGGEVPDMAGRLLGRLRGLLGWLEEPSLPAAAGCRCLLGGQVPPRCGAACSSNTRDINSSLIAPCMHGVMPASTAVSGSSRLEQRRQGPKPHERPMLNVGRNCRRRMQCVLFNSWQVPWRAVGDARLSIACHHETH